MERGFILINSNYHIFLIFPNKSLVIRNLYDLFSKIICLEKFLIQNCREGKILGIRANKIDKNKAKLSLLENTRNPLLEWVSFLI